VVASIVILAIFIVTAFMFVLYDRLLERRQRLAQKEAEASGAIVSSLFPAAYRERLMMAQERTSANTANPKALMKNLLAGNRGENVSDSNDQPIADLYKDCTVFFADIAGFTSWSSTREPVQVFCLLQAIFASMDKAANQFKVFKVETIGDCYMAVTGLPNPQQNHAQLMARFATECLVQMKNTVERLKDTLGDDTAELTLRIGLHSGPVTAGILRGEKSRFQLFGDTVNTASRMESTGEKSRIQVSSKTADILSEAGKGHWLRAREDLVEAKGKGKLQTYWLFSDSSQSTAKSMTSNATRDNTESMVRPRKSYTRTPSGDLIDV
jgi:class 3 adenylate cyclase